MADLGWMTNPDDYVECPHCHGQGNTLYHEGPCLFCKGSGAIRKHRLEEYEKRAQDAREYAAETFGQYRKEKKRW